MAFLLGVENSILIVFRAKYVSGPSSKYTSFLLEERVKPFLNTLFELFVDWMRVLDSNDWRFPRALWTIKVNDGNFSHEQVIRVTHHVAFFANRLSGSVEATICLFNFETYGENME
jgi:hypothetical protein